MKPTKTLSSQKVSWFSRDIRVTGHFSFFRVQFYIQSAVKTETKLIKPLLQIVVVSLALFLGLSRIAENAHFLSDVVAGFVLGAIIAWLMVSFPLQITRNQDISEPWHIKLSETPF